MAEPRPKRRWLRWSLRVVIVVGLLVAIAYGVLLWMLPGAITYAPNAKKEITAAGDPSPAELRALGAAHHLRVAVKAPIASLSLLVLDPPSGKPVATVIVFHGIRDSKLSMLGFGRRLTHEGYRVILLDNRGHGLSSGRILSFGVFERDDAKAVLDALEARGLLVGPVGALGFSYGGSVAIQLGALDSRVKAVVAVSTFASMRAVVKNYVRLFAPGVGLLLSEERLNTAIDDAAKAGGFDPEQANTAKAAGRLKVPLLVMHGGADLKIPTAHSETICRAAGERCRRVVVPGEGHDSMLADGSGIVWRETRRFLARVLKVR
ncbi:MAG: alpha/beta fold hydrolase [Deltaproteobacteria bacterium]|nr:alpha/beta fold hydrolase [Deltaproteobacteria bacterium]